MIDLGLWKKKKKELHLNYAMIAERANISKRSVEDIFRGYTVSPRIDTVQAIERALGLSNSPSPALSEQLSEKERRLLEAFNRLAPAMQDHIIEIVENLFTDSIS